MEGLQKWPKSKIVKRRSTYFNWSVIINYVIWLADYVAMEILCSRITIFRWCRKNCLMYWRMFNLVFTEAYSKTLWRRDSFFVELYLPAITYTPTQKNLERINIRVMSVVTSDGISFCNQSFSVSDRRGKHLPILSLSSRWKHILRYSQKRSYLVSYHLNQCNKCKSKEKVC